MSAGLATSSIEPNACSAGLVGPDAPLRPVIAIAGMVELRPLSSDVGDRVIGRAYRPRRSWC
ncbi:hypothetical protein FMEAI12_4480022 [Parafrankia sp. Ea1.12]|nr:hypothetical protein FMEAI12_4480022 [Parafrankia sp. Ea1.12]